eukprot:92250-Hanusia_phi.AAC.3
MQSPGDPGMLELLEGHDMDEEDMQLLRSKGVKKIADFHRIADVKSLQLPPVTEVKMRELLAGLGKVNMIVLVVLSCVVLVWMNHALTKDRLPGRKNGKRSVEGEEITGCSYVILASLPIW